MILEDAVARTILLADDSKTIQRAVEIVFDKEPYDVVCVGNGDDAVAKAKEIGADIVLADHLMPGRSGYDVAAALRDDPATQSVPVILLTGSASPFDEAKANASGVAATIKKPFDCQSLINRVGELLGGAASESAAAMPAFTGRPASTPTAAPAPAAAAAPATPPGAAANPAMANVPTAPQTATLGATPAPATAPNAPPSAAAAPTLIPQAPAPSSPQPSSPQPAAFSAPAASAPSSAPTPAAPASSAPSANFGAAVVEQASAAVNERVTAAAASNGETVDTAAVSAATREIIEKVVWEVVPELAETLIKEEIARLLKERSA